MTHAEHLNQSTCYLENATSSLTSITSSSVSEKTLYLSVTQLWYQAMGNASEGDYVSLLWSVQILTFMVTLLLDFLSFFLTKASFRYDLHVFVWFVLCQFVPSMNQTHQTRFKLEVRNEEEVFCIYELPEIFLKPLGKVASARNIEQVFPAFLPLLTQSNCRVFFSSSPNF